MERQREKVEHIARIESAGVGRDSRGKIGNADNLDAVLGDDLVDLGPLDIASLFGGEVDNDRAWLQRGDCLRADELRRRAARNERGRDQYIDSLAALGNNPGLTRH